MHTPHIYFAKATICPVIELDILACINELTLRKFEFLGEYGITRMSESLPAHRRWQVSCGKADWRSVHWRCRVLIPWTCLPAPSSVTPLSSSCGLRLVSHWHCNKTNRLRLVTRTSSEQQTA